MNISDETMTKVQELLMWSVNHGDPADIRREAVVVLDLLDAEREKPQRMPSPRICKHCGYPETAHSFRHIFEPKEADNAR